MEKRKVTVAGGPVTKYWPAFTSRVLSTVGRLISPGHLPGERASSIAFDYLLRIRAGLLGSDQNLVIQLLPWTDPLFEDLLNTLASKVLPLDAIDLCGLSLAADCHVCFDKAINDPKWRHVTFAEAQAPLANLYGVPLPSIREWTVDPERP